MTWAILDNQMAAWSATLASEIGLSESECRKLATQIASDVRFLPSDAKAEIALASPVALRDRLAELSAFQGWMDAVRALGRASPFVVRALVISQNYICFVYLPEFCFHILCSYTPPESVVNKCCKFLRSGRVRSFRNAIAHANWCYRSDFMAITYWAKPDHKSAMTQFEVEDEELKFWQALSRCVAYAALSNLE